MIIISRNWIKLFTIINDKKIYNNKNDKNNNEKSLYQAFLFFVGLYRYLQIYVLIFLSSL